MADEQHLLRATRRIKAPADRIFEILANPQRHVEFDGSGMLRGAVDGRSISSVGDMFTIKMHRLGDDYLMLNHVVQFEPSQRIAWEPAPGDPSRDEGNDLAKVGIPAGYRWGYILVPDNVEATLVTEFFDRGPLPDELLSDGGAWINGSTPILASMDASLKKLEGIATS